jgi:hypothetical protein
MAHFRQPTKRPALYCASLAAMFLEYAAAIYFMMTLAQTTVTKAICLLIAVVVSTWTITMWSAMDDLLKKGSFALIALIIVVLNIPAFVYDVHGFLGVTSEINSEYENSTDLAKTEKEFLTAQIENSKALAKFSINPSEISEKINKLTEQNNSLVQSKKNCKNRWGNCVKDINSQIENNSHLIESLNNSAMLANSSINSITDTKKAVQETLSGSNDNKKTHQVFQSISLWIYDDITHAKELQGKILGYSAIFFSALVMLLPYLANILCFETEIKNGNFNFIHSPALSNRAEENSNRVSDNSIDFAPAKKEIPLENFTENLTAGNFNDAILGVNKQPVNLSDLFKTSPVYKLNTVNACTDNSTVGIARQNMHDNVQSRMGADSTLHDTLHAGGNLHANPLEFKRGISELLNSNELMHGENDLQENPPVQEKKSGIGFLADIGTNKVTLEKPKVTIVNLEKPAVQETIVKHEIVKLNPAEGMQICQREGCTNQFEINPRRRWCSNTCRSAGRDKK